MKRIASIVVLMYLVGGIALGQQGGPTMRLSPIDVEDIGHPEVGGQLPSMQLEAPMANPAAEESELGTGVPDSLAVELRRQASTQAQIDRLNRPIEEIRLTNLATVGDPDGVSQSRFTDAPSRVITASGMGESDSLAQTTCYIRKRLFFEDACLERCGQSDGCLPPGIWTNTRSAARFLIDSAALPCRMIWHCCDKQVSAIAK